MKTWLLRVAAWVSQTANLFLLAGHHDQTISARCYVNRDKPGWRTGYKLVNSIFFWQEDHCFDSHMRDIDFALQVIRHK